MKGLKLAEELEIKSGSKTGGSGGSDGSAGAGQQLQIAGIRYSTSDGQQLWQQRWRRWRAREGLPGRSLDWGSWYMFASLAADGAGSGSGGSSGGGGDDPSGEA
jgi:hypothetical protein